MKKSLLFGMSLVLGISLNAQQAKPLSPKLAKQSFPFSPRNKSAVSDGTNAVNNSAAKKATPPVHNMNITATQIGETQYDLQSNSSVGSRIINHADGTISAIWTICPAGGPSYVARGTGYNYFDGSKWIYPDTVTHDVVNRLETVRTGFPSIGQMKNGPDVIVAHNASSYTLVEGSNSDKGLMPVNFVGINATIPRGSSGGAIWPRLAVGGPGDSTLHVIANYSDTNAIVMGVKQPMVYSRSLDGGTTWDSIAIALPGYDSTVTLYGGGEDYAINASGNTVAIVGGGLGENVSLWKSVNNGTTFTKTLVDAFPFAPDYSTLMAPGTDTTTNDGSLDVMLDANSMAHVVYAVGRVGRNTLANGGGGVFFPGQLGLIYWNEISQTKMSVPILLADVDVDGDGAYRAGDSTTSSNLCRYGNNSILCKPSIGMDAAGTIYVTFSMVADNDTTADQQGFRDIWLVTSADQGATWSCAMNLTASFGMSLEQSFPVLAKNVDNYLHIIYQEDSEPGTALTNKDGDGVNAINYLRVDVSSLSCSGVGIHEVNSNNLFSVGQNFPNPLNGQTTIPVTLTKSSNLTVTVSNIVGQKVIELNAGNLNAGYHNLNLDAAKLNAGIYFYTVKAGNFSVTKRMIVEN